MIQIDARKAVTSLARDLSYFQRTQVPFGTALALTETAREVAKVETAQLASTFDNPTPFTTRAFGVIAARKNRLTATVFARDVQAAYLAPYAFGGLQALGKKRAILSPIDIALNQYGNIPRGKIAALKGKPGYFVGDRKTKTGQMIGGLWQRTPAPKSGHRQRGVVQRAGTLRLVVEFTTPKLVTKHLPYEERARSTVTRMLPSAFERGMARALATAR